MPAIEFLRGTETIEDAVRASLYEAVLSVLGSTGTILPIGDPKHGLVTASTFKTVGGEQVTFTWSEPPNSFDVKPGKRGIVPVVTFNGTDEEADTPDAAYWSRVSAVFSVGAWVYLADATASTILSRYDSAGNTREWIFRANDNDDLQLVLYDESEAGNPSIGTVTDTTLVENVWSSVVATYDGTANASGIDLYLNGSLEPSTDADNAAFVAMEDLVQTTKLAHIQATPGDLFDGKMAGGPLGPFFTQKQLTADEVLRLYEVGRRALAL